MKVPKSIAILLTITLVCGNVNVTLATTKLEDNASIVLSGNDRIETAIEISKNGWKESEEVILVNDHSIADALASTPFADARKAPILLTNKSSINDNTKKELKRLGVRKVYLIGGETVLNKSIEEELKSERIIVDRVFGSDRYKTAVEIAKRINQINKISEIAVVSGSKGLVDAVSIAPAAAAKDMPIILSDDKQGIKEADEFIKKNNISKSYIIGGEAVISKDIESKLQNPERIWGRDRSETNVKVIDKFYPDVDLNNIYITKNGAKEESELIDSLAVGVLASKNNSPIMIVGNKLSEEQKNICNTKSFSTITRVGGKGNEKAFDELKVIQKRNTYDARDLKELQKLILNADANDIINLRLSNINEHVNIASKNAITINLYGSYKKSININLPNGDVVNNNDAENIIIEDIKDGTFINKGKVNNIVVNDRNGCSILNEKSATIKNIDVKNASNNVGIINNGKVDSIKVEKEANKVNLINKGVITNIKNDGDDTKVQNSGTINKIEGTQNPTIEGNKPQQGTEGGSSSSGSESNDSNEKPQEPEKPSVDEEKNIIATVLDSNTVYVKMNEVSDVIFNITENEYIGKVIKQEYKDGKYILKLDRPLGKNCEHKLNISYDNKKYTKSITNVVVDKENIQNSYYDGKTLTILTNKDSSQFKSLNVNIYGKEIKFDYSQNKWNAPDKFNITSEKKGNTTLILISNKYEDDSLDPSNVVLNCQKIELPDNSIPEASVSVRNTYGLSIKCSFNEEIKIYDSNKRQVNDLNSIKDKIKIYKDIDGILQEQENFVISEGYIDKNGFIIYSNDSKNLSYGSYVIKIEDTYIEDLSNNKFSEEIRFKFGKSKEKVSNIEELKRELEIGTNQILMQDNITSMEDLIIDEATSLDISPGKELNVDGKIIMLEGSISGNGRISSRTDIRKSKNGVLFNPKVIDVGNSTIEVANVTANSIKSILVDGTQFARKFDGTYSTTHSNMKAIKLKEVENKVNSNVRIELVSGNHIENYNVSVYAGNNIPIKGEGIIKSKINLEVDKLTLIHRFLGYKHEYDNSTEGTETGQYVEGSKAKYKIVLDKANSIINNKDATQNEVNNIIGELENANIVFQNSRVPRKATNMTELKDGLSNASILLVSENIVVTEDLYIPEYTTLVIGTGKTLTITGKTLNVDGRVVINGTVTNDGNINLGENGVFDKPSIKQTVIDSTSSIGITNIGKRAIESIKIGKSVFNIGWNDEIYTTTNPQGLYLEVVKSKADIDNEYNANPVTYIKISADKKTDQEKYNIVVTDKYNNTDEIQMPITFRVDKDKLIEEIALARDIYDNSTEGTQNAQYPIGSKDEYNKAIIVAEEVRDNPGSDADDVYNAIKQLKTAIRNFRDKMIIPRVSNINELNEMLNKKYMEKVIVVGNIENNLEIEVPKNIEMNISDNIVFTNNCNLVVNGRISGNGSIVEGEGSSITVGEEGVIFKPRLEEITSNNISGIKISNVGQKSIRYINVDGVNFYYAGEGVYNTTGVNARGIEIRNINEYSDKKYKNINPNIYVTITSQTEIKNCKVIVGDNYKGIEEIQLPVISGREK